MHFLEESFFEALFNQANVPVAVLKADDPHFTIIAVNSQYKKTTGIPDTAVGKSAFDVFRPHDKSAEQQFTLIINGLRTAIESKTEISLPVLHFEKPATFGKTPETVSYQIVITPVFGKQGQVEYLMCITRNISEQEQIRLAIEAAQKREQDMAEELAITNEELASANEELTATIEEVRQAQEELNALNESLEERVKERTQALAESETSLRYLVMSAHYPLMVLRGRNWFIEIVNQGIASLWQKPLANISGRTLMEVLPELEGQPFPALLNQVYDTGVAYGQEEETLILESAQGPVKKYVSFYYDPMFDVEGKVTGIIVAADDITEKVKARLALEKSYEEQQVLNEEISAVNEELAASNEELTATIEELAKAKHNLQDTVNRLAQSESRIRFMVADAPVAIGLLTGPELIIESANDMVLDVWGKTADIIGKPLHVALPELDGQPFLKLLNNVFTSGVPYYGNEVKAYLVRKGTLDEVYFNFVYHPLKSEWGNTYSIMVVATEVTEQVNARRKVEESELRFRFMLNAIPQQVWTATPDGALDYVNENVSNDFGISGFEIVGQGWQTFIHPEDLPATLMAWQKSLEAGKEYQAEFRLKFKNGEYHWHLARAIPMVENGKVKLWLGTNTNIDLQKRNEQKKDEFLSIASHELKTPLTSIKAFNQLMSRTNEAQKLTSFVSKSAEHIVRLEKLINDLLDVTKINAGKMDYTMQVFDFKQMLQESIDSVQLTAPSHRIILQSAADVNYTGDRFRLEQVINNFLTNAVKYSPEAHTVLVNSKVELDNLVVSVQDFGIGIAQDHLDRLFDRYYRVDNTAMRFEGLGLGLFISSEILKRHNGSFWIESEQGKGSIFYFRLPLVYNTAIKPANTNNTDTFYQDSTITISYNKAKSRLDVDWTGFQDMESVQNGCMLLLDMLAKNKCHKVVNDNSHVQGTWSEAAEWVGEKWFPMMEKAGLRYFAWIFSSSAFSQLSAKKSIDVMRGNVITQLFTDINEGQNWVDSQ